MRILYVLLEYAEQGDFVLAPTNGESVGVCTFFPPRKRPPCNIEMYAGDGTIFGFYRALREAHKENEYDIIHAHAPHVGLFLIPFLVVTGRGFAGTVFTAHHSFGNSNVRLVHRLMEVPVFWVFQRIVCVSMAARRSFPEWYRWLAGRDVRVIENSVDLEAVSRAEPNWPGAGDPKFGVASVGRLIKIKDPAVLLRAFKASQRATGEELVYVGEGQLSRELRLQAVEMGIDDQVVFTGLIERDEVYSVLKRADVFVSTSRGEGLPVALLEAMACSCPVIVSDIPPHREVLKGMAGVQMVPPGDVNGFTRALDVVREIGEVERQKMAMECRQRIEERYHRDAAISKYEELYGEISGP